MAGDLFEMLERAFEHVPDDPYTGPEFIEAVGGRRAAAQQFSGLPGMPAKSLQGEDPALYREQVLRWRTASRRAQRLDAGDTPGRQSRGLVVERLNAEQRETLRENRVIKKYSAMLQEGARTRIRCMFRDVSPKAVRSGRNDDRVRTMPVEATPGVYLDPETINEIQAAFERDEIEAGRLYRDAFFEGYGMDPEDFDLSDVIWVRVWPADGDEPV